MDQKQADKLVIDTFQNGYDDSRYLKFVNELFNGKGSFHQYGENAGFQPGKMFKDHIESYQYFGRYTDPEKKQILVVSVRLRRSTARDRARVMQRNFAAELLRGKVTRINAGDAALIAFYGDDPEDWRLSLVKFESELKCDEKGICVYENLTSAKRSSFLVGKHEPSHTCMTRFSPLILETTFYPSLADLEEVFHVEKVTMEFFEKYSKCFEELNKSLESALKTDSEVRDEFLTKDIKVEDFSKKLLGQIVFLYFLQKKGWLGVKVDADWGSGPKDFMKQLFEGKIIKYQNFFDDVLEPLFYDGLAIDRRGNNDYSSKFDIRLPFLNGGLFEPMKNYNWSKTHIKLDNDIFKTIIVDTFERYNFTVKEDEPLEREVAVDPEMLGKVFERLLNKGDRKAKGAFYTPRYIVHYICQESLIQYLSKNTDAPYADLKLLIQKGNEMYAATLYQSREATCGKSVDIGIFIPSSIVERADELDTLLRNIKVADPAVGSGAFPVGMMNEIVKARNALTVCFKTGRESKERSAYNLKREAIEHSLYGVDIESSAVDISKLRFWLSLIVDEDNTDEIQPLPNLDQKIMVGNSLIDKYEGIQIFDRETFLKNLNFANPRKQEIEDRIEVLNNERSSFDLGAESERSSIIEREIKKLKEEMTKILSNPKKDISPTLDANYVASVKKFQRGMTEYQLLQKSYFNEQDKRKKNDLCEKLSAKEWEILEDGASSSNNPKLQSKLKSLKDKHSKPFFLWELYFSEVFARENPGFDCVIGNPPYHSLQKLDKEDKKNYGDMGYDTHDATGDIYGLFYEKGYRLLRNNGTLGFITSNTWMRSGFGNKLRAFFAKNTNPLVLLDFAGKNVFKDAMVKVNILLFSKSANQKETCVCKIIDDCSENMSEYIEEVATYQSFNDKGSWVVLSLEEREIKEKIKKIGTPLKDWDIQIYRGILTGYNEAFIIDGKKKDELIAEDPKSAEIIRPILQGQDVKRYGYDNRDLWLLFIPWHFPLQNDPTITGSSEIAEKEFQKQYPAVYNHLLKYKPKLSARNESETGIRYEWYALQRWGATYWEEFYKNKIAYREISDIMNACKVEEGIFVNNKCYIITGESLEYLICILNSKIFNKLLLTDANLTGGKGKGFLNLISIPKLDPNDQKPYLSLYNQMMNTKNEKERIIIDNKIDELVYGLYQLTQDEIKTIEDM